MTSFTWRCSVQAAAIARLRTGPIPSTSVRRRGSLVDDLEGGEAEVLDEPRGHHLPDPAHQSRAEIALDADQGRGLERGVGLDLELFAVLAIALPGPGELDALARLHPEEIPDNSYRRAPARDEESEDGPAVLLVGIDDAIDDPGESAAGRRGRGRGGRGSAALGHGVRTSRMVSAGFPAASSRAKYTPAATGCSQMSGVRPAGCGPSRRVVRWCPKTS